MLIMLRTQTAISADGDLGVVFALQVCTERFADQNDILVGQVLLYNSSNVVFSENFGIHHISRFVVHKSSFETSKEFCFVTWKGSGILTAGAFSVSPCRDCKTTGRIFTAQQMAGAAKRQKRGLNPG
jgi:hypothetical protein